MTAFNSIYNTISTFALKYLNFDNIFYILIGFVAFSIIVRTIFGKKENASNQKVNQKNENITFITDDLLYNPIYSQVPGNIYYHKEDNFHK